MARNDSAYIDGTAQAERDIVSGQLKLRIGARSAWGEDLAQVLQTRFSVELIVLSCLVTEASASFDSGYNAIIEAHLDRIHGVGCLKTVWDEVQQRRQMRYVAWHVQQRSNNPG